MNVVTRGVRNAFRNQIRTAAIVIILGLSIGLALSMLVAHRAVEHKITSVKGTVGNTITISPAGFRGFAGGGNPLTQAELNKVKAVSHVSSLSESLNDRLTSSDTNLQSSITAGSLGRRFAGNGGQSFSPPSGDFGGQGDSGGTVSFTPPVTVIGTTDPTDLTSTTGGGTFKLTSGQVFAGNSTENVAVVGSALAAKNSLSVGSTFTAYGATIKAVGIFDGGNSFANSQLIMPLATVQTLSNQSGGVTSATATIDSVSNVGAATTAIKSVLGSAADVTNDQTRAQDAIAPLENIKSISLYSLVGAVVAGAVIILLTMIMIVRERRREIGVIKAIGASNLKVAFQFMTEAVTFTLLGAVLGIGLGVVAANPITKLLVDNTNSSTASTTVMGAVGRAGGGFRPAGQGLGAVRANLTNIHAAVGWSIILYGLAAAVVIAVVGSVLSAWFIAKIRPAEVMRAE